MRDLEYKESWVLKTWCFSTVLLEKTIEIPLDCKEIRPVHPKGNQSWIFIGSTDAEAETPVLWPPNAKNWLIWKDPDAVKDWRQEEKWTIENEMVVWYYQFDRHESEQAPGGGDGQGSLVCCSSWGHKESDTTEWRNWLIHLKVKGIGQTDISYIFITFLVPFFTTSHHSSGLCVFRNPIPQPPTRATLLESFSIGSELFKMLCLLHFIFSGTWS